MNFWQILLICNLAATVGRALAKDGEMEKGQFSFIGTLIGTLLLSFVLYKAGAFHCP